MYLTADLSEQAQIRTLGGHRRFRASEIQRCLEEMATEDR
jgi:hypothetical protein